MAELYGSRPDGLSRFRAASQSRAATSPPTWSCAAGRCSRSSRASGSTSTWPSSTGTSRASATTRARETLDATGRYVVPGFVDAHMHLESSKLLVDEFARLVLPFGTTAVVADPHEIANVLGTDGVHWLLDVCARIPLDVWFMASSCVPASSFESPRRALTAGDLDALLRRRRVIGLAEMMNFPGVIAGDPRELAKLALAQHVDGHAPGVLGRDAQRVRRRRHPLRPRGVHGRGGPRAAARRDVAADPRGLGGAEPARAAAAARRVRAEPDRVLHRRPRAGAHRRRRAHQRDGARRRRGGIPPEDALVCATLNPASWHGLSHLGAVAPGYQADLLVLPDLERFVPDVVLKSGRPVGRDPACGGARLGAADGAHRRARARDVPHPVAAAARARVIGLVEGQIVTESLVEEPTVRAGEAVADAARDLAKIAVIERHLATGRIGLGFVRGFGLQRGALASTVAHDAHNVVVVGTSDAAMAFAVRRLANLGGGIVAVDGSEVVAELPLPVAGLLSDAPLEEVVERSRALVDAARRARLHDRGAVPAARVPRAVGDPEPEADRPRPGGRRPLRARPAGDVA